MIGGVRNESIAAAAKRSVEEADRVLELMRPVTDFFRPLGDDVYFYVLTRGDVYFAHATRRALENSQHVLAKLFQAAHAVITEYRKLRSFED